MEAYLESLKIFFKNFSNSKIRAECTLRNVCYRPLRHYYNIDSENDDAIVNP